MFTGLSTSQFLGGLTLPGAIHTSGIYPSSRLSESYVGQCWTPDQGGVYRVAGSGKAQVRGAKWQSSDSSFIAPDTYPARSVRTRLGTARVPTGTSVGMVSSPAFTNKVTCRKTNPTDTSNVAKVGDADVVLSLVSGTLADFQGCKDVLGNTIDLSQICSTYKYYRIVNGSATWGGAICGGSCGNTNKHSARFFVRGSGTLYIIDSWSSAALATITLTAEFKEIRASDWTPNNAGTQPYLRVGSGVTLDFILPELVESSYLPADPIVPLTPAADTLAAFTRAAIYMEEDTAGVFTTVTEVAREYMQNNCFATLGAGGADVFAGWTESVAGSSTITQELVDLPSGFTSACKLTVDGSGSLAYIDQVLTKPTLAGSIETVSIYAKAGHASGVRIELRISNGTTTQYLSSTGLSWTTSAELYTPTFPTSWGKWSLVLPVIPSGYTTFTRLIIYRNSPYVSQSHLITGISIGDTGIQNPYSSAASLMSDGSVVPVVAGASWAQNFAIFGTCVPDAGGQAIAWSGVSSTVDTSNRLGSLFISSTSIDTTKQIGSTTSILIGTSYTHAAKAPFDYLTIQTIHGMAIRVRPHATMTWSAWATNVTVNGKKPAPIGTKYQIGALNGGGGIAGKHPKVSIFELGNQASLAAYQDRAMLLAGRIA